MRCERRRNINSLITPYLGTVVTLSGGTLQTFYRHAQLQSPQDQQEEEEVEVEGKSENLHNFDPQSVMRFYFHAGREGSSEKVTR